jgi:putative transposase
VARLLKQEGLRSQTGYRRRPGARGGKPAVVAPNRLQHQFTVAAPNQSWVTDITYIRTHEGWLYLAVVVDLFSRQVVGWSMGSRIDTGLVLDALLMALWRRRPKETVMVHSDQGSQFTGHDWQDFLREHNLVCSMSRRGNCHDNAVAESFFQLLKRERIRRQIYRTRDDARADVFNYIEMFYNPKRSHVTAGDRSPVEFERPHSQLLTGVEEIPGDSLFKHEACFDCRNLASDVSKVEVLHLKTCSHSPCNVAKLIVYEEDVFWRKLHRFNGQFVRTGVRLEDLRFACIHNDMKFTQDLHAG